MYICKKKAMVKAYTLGDKIVQMGFNDSESLVGMVFRSGSSGTDPIFLSSITEMNNATDLASNVVPQVIAFKYLGNFTLNNWFKELEKMFTGDSLDTSILASIFKDWGADLIQYIQIRSVSVDLAPDSTSAAQQVYMKITADAYTATSR
jgi:hypothetical protein